MNDNDEDDVTKIFPQKLMGMLADPESHDSVAWLPHGRSFVITDRDKFSDVVLPKYFRKTKYASFTRKLNRWNFKRVPKGPDAGAYYHEFFQRDKEAMCIQMYCKNDRFKFATTPGKTWASEPKLNSNAANLPTSNKVESLSPMLKLPTQQASLISPMVLPKLLSQVSIDPATQVRALLARQQQLRQAQISALKSSNNSVLGIPENRAKQIPLLPPSHVMVQQIQLQQKQRQLQQQIQQLQQQLQLEDQNKKKKQQQKQQLIMQQQQQNLHQLQQQIRLQEETKKQQQHVSHQIALLQSQLAMLEMKPEKETIMQQRRASAA
eukprot:CAMPEP_0178913690 /NCGR_PEP_ID=MMETSP0786-20121207/10986_1 /TAXON_ID=186022 /ORGANISM="Thalassionema frauenfeldii, Strain CCMP 1798" /LENGTH=321 /DNA_ID=CAMNT_0020586467 /DNA_START=174 /DNA_END=1139 /DNA_ORIENTATION=-